MKKFFLFLLSALAVTVSLTGCHREVDAPAPRRSMADLQYANVPITLGDRMETGTTKASAGDNEWIATYDSFENDLCPDTKSSVDIDSVEKFVKATLFAIIYDHGNFIGNSYIETTTKSFDWRLPYGQDLEIVIYTIVNYGDLDLSYWKQLADDDSLYEEEFLDGNGPVFECASSSALKALEGSDKGLPMAGITRIEDPEASDPLTIKVKRLFAKYNIYFDDSYLQSLGYSVQILHLYACKTNTVCPFFDEGYGVGNNASGLSQLKSIDFGSSTDLVEANEFSSSHAVTLYFLENCQGDKSGATRWDNVMENVSGTEYMSYIDVGVKVTSATGHDRNYNYRIYLGTDCTTNFDVIRNRFYTIKVRLTDHDQEGFKFTNPNTLSVASGETIEVPFETTIVKNGLEFRVLNLDGTQNADFTVSLKANSFKANTSHHTGYAYEGIVILTADDNVNDGTYAIEGGNSSLKDKRSVFVLDPLVLDFVPYTDDMVHQDTRQITDTDGLVPGFYRFRSELGPGLKDFYDSHLSDVTMTGGANGYSGHYVNTLTVNGKDYLEFTADCYESSTYNFTLSVAGFGSITAYSANVCKSPILKIYDLEFDSFVDYLDVPLSGRTKDIMFCYCNTHGEPVYYCGQDGQLPTLSELIEFDDERDDLTGFDQMYGLVIYDLSDSDNGTVDFSYYLSDYSPYRTQILNSSVREIVLASSNIGLLDPITRALDSEDELVAKASNPFYGFDPSYELVWEFHNTSEEVTNLQLTSGDNDVQFSLSKVSGNLGSTRSGGWSRAYLTRDSNDIRDLKLHYRNDSSLPYYGVVSLDGTLTNIHSGQTISKTAYLINLARIFKIYCALDIVQNSGNHNGTITYSLDSNIPSNFGDVTNYVETKSYSEIESCINNTIRSAFNARGIRGSQTYQVSEHSGNWNLLQGRGSGSWGWDSHDLPDDAGYDGFDYYYTTYGADFRNNSLVDYDSDSYAIYYSSPNDIINWAVVTYHISPQFVVKSLDGMFSEDELRSTLVQTQFTRNSSTGLFINPYANSTPQSGSLSTTGFIYNFTGSTSPAGHNTLADLQYNH